MLNDNEIASLKFSRPCPVCDDVMELSAIDAEAWSPRTIGERRKFRCSSCGVTQSGCTAIAVAAPSTVPGVDFQSSPSRDNCPSRISPLECASNSANQLLC
jgi:hypothetical protein